MNDIRKAYHRLARQYHPDKNEGDDTKFKQVSYAYQILSDPQKRDIYDQYGMAGIKGDAGDAGFGSMFGGDIFSHFFGGPFGGGGRQRRAKGETIGIPLEVTLEELYTGVTKTVEYKRKAICKSCLGTGGKSSTGAGQKCKKCQGSGIQVTHRQLGGSLIQQIQSQCSDCGGTGDFIKEKDRCKKCKGKKVVEEDKKLEVPISPGMSNQQKIPFRGEADEAPDMDAGDVLVILQQTDNVDFVRDGIDLITKKKITVAQALCGFSTVITHLDGRKLLVVTPPGHVVSPDSMLAVRDEGMPAYRRPETKGHLYIKFEITFPENSFLPHDKLQELEKLLPPAPNPIIPPEHEDVDLHDFENTRGVDGSTGGREAYNNDDDDDQSGGMPRVGCSQQ